MQCHQLFEAPTLSENRKIGRLAFVVQELIVLVPSGEYTSGRLLFAMLERKSVPMLENFRNFRPRNTRRNGHSCSTFSAGLPNYSSCCVPNSAFANNLIQFLYRDARIEHEVKQWIDYPDDCQGRSLSQRVRYLAFASLCYHLSPKNFRPCRDVQIGLILMH